MKQIILVEDDDSIRDITKLVLERAGYALRVYPGGDSLLQNLADTPDLFILDKQLSGMDGLDLCRALKGRPDTKNIPVIMLSASPHISQLYKEAGADDFLEKPFNTKKLREVVAKYVG